MKFLPIFSLLVFSFSHSVASDYRTTYQDFDNNRNPKNLYYNGENNQSSSVFSSIFEYVQCFCECCCSDALDELDRVIEQNEKVKKKRESKTHN